MIEAERPAPARTALVVVDMQNDYVHRDGAVLRHFREQHGGSVGADGPTPAELMVPTLIRLVDAARAAGVSVVWIVTHRTPWTDTPRAPWLRDAADEAWGTALYAGLEPRADEPVVVKRRHSCFFATDMELVLKRLRAETLVFTGVGTPFCVEGSVRDACARDYETVVVADATSTRERDEHEAALRRMAVAFARVASTDDLVAVW